MTWKDLTYCKKQERALKKARVIESQYSVGEREPFSPTSEGVGLLGSLGVRTEDL